MTDSEVKIYELIGAIDDKDITEVKSILEKANKQNKKSILNEKNSDGYYPLFWATSNNNLEMVQLLMENANQWGIQLNLNEKVFEGWYPLLYATAHWNNLEIVQLLFDYAKEHGILLVFDEKDIEEFIEENKIDIYYEGCKNISEINSEILGLWRNYEKNESLKDERELLKAVEKEDNSKIESILNNANNNKKTIDLNEIKNKCGYYPFYRAAAKNNLEMFQLLMEYANKCGIQLELNEKDMFGSYPLLYATEHNNLEMVQFLMEYANKLGIQLELNGKDKNGKYPLYRAVEDNNLEMVRLLMEYTNKLGIQLKLNEKDTAYDRYPLLYATVKWNNFEMVQLLFEYANEHNIHLVFDENDIGMFIETVNSCKCKDISEINSEILKLWRNYGKK